MKRTIIDEEGDSRDQHVDAGLGLISSSIVCFPDFDEKTATRCLHGSSLL